jgi:O-antigen biosynthesis protein
MIDSTSYKEWVQKFDTLDDDKREVIRSRIERLHYKPLISVLMPVFNTPLDLLEEAIKSVRAQLYSNWELCIADDASSNKAIRKLLRRYAAQDARIKVRFRRNNGRIAAASNSALRMATGEFIALLDHDDLLPEHALFWVADAINNHPSAKLIYSDEDKICLDGYRSDPYFKCDWNPELFLSHNMICHLGIYQTSLVKSIGGFRRGFDGSQDYDLALRCTEQLTKHEIHHIPRILYHWRILPGSTALNVEEKPYAVVAGAQAIREHLARRGFTAQVEILPQGYYRVQHSLPKNQPLVSLIIPTRNGFNLISQCVESILNRTTYKDYEILIVDNGSDDSETLSYLASLESSKNNIRVIRDDRPFNYSAINNAAVEMARGSIVGLLNNDTEVTVPEWLSEMVSLSVQPELGCIGARLWYPDDHLQHGGVILGIGGVAGHSHLRLPLGSPGYFSRAELIQSFSAVTGACLLVRKEIYQKVGGLNETNLAIAFNDVDFCLRVREAGFRNVWTPYAGLYHHESASRGYEDTPEKLERFGKEIEYMKTQWKDTLLKDPAYSPNLTLDDSDFSLAWPPRVELL